MKKIPIILCLLIFSVSITSSQKIIENPKKPLNKNAGRIVHLKETMRITDEEGEFYLQSPRNLRITDDGSIFILDREQLLQFNEDGKYIRNYFKKGQGPGELNFVLNYVLEKDHLIVQDTSPSKLMYFDFNGKFQEEKSLNGINGQLQLLFSHEGSFYFIKSDRPRPEKELKVIDWSQLLVSLSGEMKSLNELADFPLKLMMSQGSATSLMEVYTALVQKRYLCVVHTPEYMIHFFDLDSNKLIKSVTREYKRVKRLKDQSEGGIIGSEKTPNPPGYDYLIDVNQIVEFNGNLMAKTSTKDKNGNSLYDVFTVDGEYLDSFYLSVNGRLVATHENYIFVVEKDGDELLSIVKYQVINKANFK